MQYKSKTPTWFKYLCLDSVVKIRSDIELRRAIIAEPFSLIN